MQENGIRSWDDLAGKSSDELKAILAGAGLSMMNPDSWPRQAQLAADGDWDNLAALQHTLDAGRKNVGDGDNPAKVDKLAEKLSSARLANREAGINYAAVFGSDTLEIIEGIGPKVSELLATNGISTWADLASKSPDEIQPSLEAAGSVYKMMDPSSWPQQAKLAAEGQWTALIEYQKFLDGGKEALEQRRIGVRRVFPRRVVGLGEGRAAEAVLALAEIHQHEVGVAAIGAQLRRQRLAPVSYTHLTLPTSDLV